MIREESENRTSCDVDEVVFAIPTDYSRIGGQSSDQVRRQFEDDDDQLLQYAIRQSVSDGGISNGGPAAVANGSLTSAASRQRGGQQQQQQQLTPRANETGTVAESAAPADNGGEEVDIWEALQVCCQIRVEWAET